MAPRLRDRKKAAESLDMAAAVTRTTKPTNTTTVKTSHVNATVLSASSLATQHLMTAKGKGEQQMESINGNENEEAHGDIGPSRRDNTQLSHVFNLKTSSKLGDITAKCHFGPDSNYAQYDPTGKRFALKAQFHARTSFALEKTTFSSGPFAGYQALVLVPVPAHSFRFLELPPELRNMVYEDLLAPKGHQIMVNGKSARTWEAYLQPAASTPRDGNYFRRAQASLGPHVSIVSVCREVHEEALSVLYGCNTIRVLGAPALEWFLETIGPAREHLRDVNADLSFWIYCKSHTMRLRRSANLLAEASNLTRLNLKIDDMLCSYRYEAQKPFTFMEIAKSLKPLYKALLERGGTESLNALTFHDVEQCHKHHAEEVDDPMVKTCADCKRLRTNYNEALAWFTKGMKSCLDDLEMEEKEERLKKEKTRLNDRVMAKKHVGKAKAEPVIRHETGRAKRHGVTDKVISYMEVDEEEEVVDDEEATEQENGIEEEHADDEEHVVEEMEASGVGEPA